MARRIRPRPDPARDARIIAACDALLPLLENAQQLLRRKRLAGEELVAAVRGLAAWPETHASTIPALEIATMIASPGAGATETAFAIVARLHAVTPGKAERLYRTWLTRRLRARVLELR